MTNSVSGADSAIPAYLRVTRAGNTFSTFSSTDGANFVQIGTAQTISMGATLLVGIGVTSHADGSLATGVFDNISIVRAGGHFWGGQTFPAIWVFSASKVFQGIRVSNVDIVDPTYSGIMFQTNYVGGQPQNPIKDTVFTNVTITGAKKSGDAYDAKSGFGIWANPMPEAGQGPAVGSATFTNLQLSNNYRDIENTTSTFTIIRN